MGLVEKLNFAQLLNCKTQLGSKFKSATKWSFWNCEDPHMWTSKNLELVLQKSSEKGLHLFPGFQCSIYIWDELGHILVVKSN